MKRLKLGACAVEASRSAIGVKRAQFAPAFEGRSCSYGRKNGSEVGLFSTHCSRLASAAQAPMGLQIAKPCNINRLDGVRKHRYNKIDPAATFPV